MLPPNTSAGSRFSVGPQETPRLRRSSGDGAKGRRAPDLTHVGSRSSLAAGTLQNTAAARVHWIADPQHYKPGVDMPPFAAAPEDLVAISAYLGSLQ